MPTGEIRNLRAEAALACRRQSIMFHYEKAWQDVRLRIARAAEACGRDPGSVRLVAVSKTFPADAVRAVHALGQRDFGENYVQEGAAKMADLTDLTDIRWHLIGPLQSNKTTFAASSFAWVETLDRAKIATRLSAARPGQKPPLDVCIQINVSGESSKSGVEPEDAVGLGGSKPAWRRLAQTCYWGFPFSVGGPASFHSSPIFRIVTLSVSLPPA